MADTLIERLRADYMVEGEGYDGRWVRRNFRNPDGPEAASRIEAQAAEIERLSAKLAAVEQERDEAMTDHHDWKIENAAAVRADNDEIERLRDTMACDRDAWTSTGRRYQDEIARLRAALRDIRDVTVDLHGKGHAAAADAYFNAHARAAAIARRALSPEAPHG